MCFDMQKVEKQEGGVRKRFDTKGRMSPGEEDIQKEGTLKDTKSERQKEIKPRRTRVLH